VLAALLIGAAAALAAVLGLTGSRGRGDDRPSATLHPYPTSVPEIYVNETAFAAGGAGGMVIRVSGAVMSFRPGDRLYATAKAPARRTWWISDPVIPLPDGTWVTLIDVDPAAGEQIIVAALRVPAASFDAAVTTSPQTGRPTDASPWPTSGPAHELIEVQLRAHGADALVADVWSNSFVVLAPSQ